MSYWNDRYLYGGKSGKGSTGKYRSWKWRMIKKHVGRLGSVIDVGCGDLSFWKGRLCKEYTGIDISQYIIARNSVKKKKWKFICANSGKNLFIEADTVLCLDMLFHVMDDIEFERTIENMMFYSVKHLVIYTWHKNPLLPETRDSYQVYRNFEPVKNKILDWGFDLVAEERVPYDQFGAMYIFKRRPVDDSYLQ